MEFDKLIASVTAISVHQRQVATDDKLRYLIAKLNSKPCLYVLNRVTLHICKELVVNIQSLYQCFTTKLCGLYVVMLLNWTPIIK